MDAHSVSPPPAPTPVPRRKLLTKDEFAALGRSTTAWELERLKTTTEYLDRQDDFQQREATLEAAVARHSWLRHVNTVAQVAGVGVLLCACLCMSVVFVANSYPRALGLPRLENSIESVPVDPIQDVEESTSPLSMSPNEGAATQQPAERSASSVSGTIAGLKAPVYVYDNDASVAWPSQAVSQAFQPHTVSAAHGNEHSAADASSELEAPLEGGLHEVSGVTADGLHVATELVVQQQPLESEAPVKTPSADSEVLSEGQDGRLADNSSGAAARVQAPLSTHQHDGEVSLDPPSLAPTAAPDAELQQTSQQNVDSAVPSVHLPGSVDASAASAATSTLSNTQPASQVEQPSLLHNVFGPSSLCSTTGSAERQSTPGELSMHLGTDVFGATAAFEVFCISASAITTAGAAAVNAAGSPTVAVAYLLLVMTMTAIAYMFIQPTRHPAGVYGHLADAISPLVTPRQALSGAQGLPRRSPSFQRLLEDPGSAVSPGAEAVMHGAITHTPSTAGTTMHMPSPWRGEVTAMAQHADQLQHQDEDQGAAITKSMETLMRMRSQAQRSAAAGDLPGSPGDASGSDAENVPDKNVLDRFPMDEHEHATVPEGNALEAFTLDEHDTVCYADGDSEPDTVQADDPHMHVPHAEEGVAAEAPVESSANAHALHEEEAAAVVVVQATDVVLAPAGAVGTRSAVVALANGTAAAASAMAAVSAATDGVQAKQRALVARLTELEHSATQRRVRLEAEGDSTSGGLSGARISGSGVQEETQELTSMVEQIVSQVDCTVGAVHYLARQIYGPDVVVDITGENWHTEARNIIKIAALHLQQADNPSHWSPEPSSAHVPTSASPAASGALPSTPQTLGERAGSTSASPEMIAAESAQCEVARIVEQMLGGSFQNDLTDSVRGVSGPAAAALYRLQNRLCELNGLQAPPAPSFAANRCPPTSLSLPLNQQCDAATPFPTPASATTTNPTSAGAAISPRELLARCQEFSSGLGAVGCADVVEVTLDVATSGLVVVHFAVCAASQSSAQSHRLFRSLSVGLNSQEVQNHVAQRQLPNARLPSPLSSTQHEPLAILPAVTATGVGGSSMHEDTTSAFDEAHMSFLSHSAAPAWHPQSETTTTASMPHIRARNSPLGVAIHLDTASAAKLAQTELEAESTAESVGETWSMPTPTQLSGRDTGTGLSQGLASNVSELYERGFQLEQSIQDIDDRGCFRAGQDAAVESRPQSAAEGIAELQRILCSSAADAAAQADSGEWVFDHTLLEAAVTDAYATAIRNWEDVTLTKDEVHTLRRYLTRTMSDIMARVATPSPSIASSRSQSTDGAEEDDVDAENSGNAAYSGQRDKFLSYRYLVGTVGRTLGDVEEQDVRFRHVLAEAVSLQEQLAVARKGFSHLQAELNVYNGPHHTGSAPGMSMSRDSDGDLPDPNALPGAASRDMLLSQLVTWNPADPEAPTPANVLRQFREVDRPLAPLAAQMDTDPGLAAGCSLLWKKEQLDDFILGMSAHSDALAQDLATAVTTMRATLAAVHSHTLDLLRFFESNSYTPPQAVSAALNKAAAHVGADLSGDISFAASADGAGLDYMMRGVHGSGGARQSPTSMWIENSVVSGLGSASSILTPDSQDSAPRTAGGAYAHCSTQGILTDSNTSPPASNCSPAWAGLAQLRAHTPHSPPAVDTSPLRASAAGMSSPTTQSPLQFPSSSLPEAPTPSLTFNFGSQGRSTAQRGSRNLENTSAPPSTEFATPHGRDPLSQVLAFSHLPEASVEGAAESPRSTSPTLSPLLLSAIQQQQEQQRSADGVASHEDRFTHTAEQSLVPSHPVTIAPSAGASGPTSNDSSLSFVIQPPTDLQSTSTALQPNPLVLTTTTTQNTSNAAPKPQWPLVPDGPFSTTGATTASIAPAGPSTIFQAGASNTEPSPKLPFNFGASSTSPAGVVFGASNSAAPFQMQLPAASGVPSRPAGESRGARPRKSLSATGDGISQGMLGSRLPRRPSYTGSGNRSSRASSVECARDEAPQTTPASLSPLLPTIFSSGATDASECMSSQYHAQEQQAFPPLPPTAEDASVPLAPLAMQGSVRPAVREASSMMLPAGSGISFTAAGVSAAAAAVDDTSASAGVSRQLRSVPPPLMLSDDLQAAAAAEDDALLSEEEADGIVHTFPGLSSPIRSPTEPTVGPPRAQRCAQESNPLRSGYDFSKTSPPHAAPVGSWPLNHTAAETNGASPATDLVSPRAVQPPFSPESGYASESSPATVSAGISDLSLPRASTPGASTPTPRGSAHRTHDRPWDTMHTHDNVLFSDKSPGAEGACASGGSAGDVRALQLTPPSAQKKLPEGSDVGLARDAARMPSPDENSSENLPFQAK